MLCQYLILGPDLSICLTIGVGLGLEYGLELFLSLGVGLGLSLNLGLGLKVGLFRGVSDETNTKKFYANVSVRVWVLV